MSDIINNDVYTAFARKVASDLKNQNGGNNFQPREFEEVKWVGLTQGDPHIIHFIGNPPDSLTPGFKAGPTDAHEIFISDIKADDGKKMTLKLPLPSDISDKDHPLWKIIRKINEKTYVDKKPIPKYDKSHADLFNRIMHGGWDPTNPKELNNFKYSKGWGGQKVIIMNVIDREDEEWHREHKHSKLLSRNVSTSINAEGNTVSFVSPGIPSYGFVDKLAETCSNYGNWAAYDVAIKRTGQKNSPYNVYNATAFKAGRLKDIPEQKYAFVKDVLSEEEKAYELYDIEKLYGPTTYTKIDKRLGGTIKTFDAAFGTNYYDDIHQRSLIEIEEAKNKAASEQMNENTSSISPIPEVPVTPAPVSSEIPTTPIVESRPLPTRPSPQPAATIAATEKLDPSKIALLKGFEFLTNEQKDQIDDVIVDSDGKVSNITYNTSEQVVACPTCNAPGLLAHTHCILCGVKF